MRKIILVGLISAAPLLAACDTQLTPAEQALLHADLVVGCPILLNQVDPIVRADFNGNVAKLGLNNLELACPPNPEPNSIPVITADLLTAFISLVPYLPRLSKAGQTGLAKLIGDANTIAAAHGAKP